MRLVRARHGKLEVRRGKEPQRDEGELEMQRARLLERLAELADHSIEPLQRGLQLALAGAVDECLAVGARSDEVGAVRLGERVLVVRVRALLEQTVERRERVEHRVNALRVHEWVS